SSGKPEEPFMKSACKFPKVTRRVLMSGAVGLALATSLPAFAADTIKIGLVAALSGQSAKSGQAITRGLTIAIDEINEKGGVLGKPLELVSRDDESNPGKGLVAARELVQREGVAALIGGLDSPHGLLMRIIPGFLEPYLVTRYSVIASSTYSSTAETRKM
ncbi:MAG: ABC transporter substrate-binding protein, partial [Rhodospirillaceae bacterium]